MTDTDDLRIQQINQSLASFKGAKNAVVPKGGWARAIRDALGMTNVQLSRRLNRKASQTVEDLLRSEAAGTIKLKTLDELARAMNCRLVYAFVPEKPIDDLRYEQALKVAQIKIGPVAHTMSLEGQGLTDKEHQRAVERTAQRLLGGSSRKLW